MKKSELAEKARELFKNLKKEGFNVFYDHAGAIGRRYARADEIGTPFCFTVDYETVEKNSITIRDRDSMKQIRVPFPECPAILRKLTRRETGFLDLGKPIN